MKKRWMLKTTKINIEEVARKSFISKHIAKILVNRNITTAAEIDKFLKGSIDQLNDPFLMADMDKGTDIINNAIKSGKKIVIYGDYDVDGVCSTVILYNALSRLKSKVSFFIPDREKDGYGLNKNSIMKLKESGTEVILTCDNGISAVEEVKYAKELGIEMVITDHHELPFLEKEDGTREEILPEADAVINPKRKDCNYPFKLLCGAAIAFKFITALYIKRGISIKEAIQLMQFAGIATICDVVDLIGENRIIAKEALKLLNNTNNIGINALKKYTEIKEINEYVIGFVIGPCINASGRLENAKMAVELMITDDNYIGDNLARELVDLNKKRQKFTQDSVERIEKIIESSREKFKKVIVVYDENIHESIAGIVAGRIREKYNLPTIVLTAGHEMPKGSGRSIEEYNMFEELLKCKDIIEKFGGHPMAAGLSIKEENIEVLFNQLNDNFSLSEEVLVPKVSIDVAMHIDEVTPELIYDLNMLQPFGKGNTTPTFADKNILVEKAYVMGKEKNVLKFIVKNDGLNQSLEAISFNTVNEFVKSLKQIFGEEYGDLTPFKTYNIMNLPTDLRIDCVYSPQFNEFNGNKKINLKIIDFRIN
ncbi:MAG: single-stranded-DNA-specific exonuclease RecJ [Clostridiaceae bacterium]